MSNLTKRVDVLEKRGKGRRELLWVEQDPRGLVHDGKLYGSAGRLLHALGLDPDDALLISWRSG